MQSEGRRRGLFAVLIVVAILIVLYLRGTFDPLLYRFGLNHYPCTRDLTGHTVCGQKVVGTPYGLVPVRPPPPGLVPQRGAA